MNKDFKISKTIDRINTKKKKEKKIRYQFKYQLFPLYQVGIQLPKSNVGQCLNSDPMILPLTPSNTFSYLNSKPPMIIFPPLNEGEKNSPSGGESCFSFFLNDS